MIKLSVIIPLYNAGSFLQRCVNGILSQTSQLFELILIDDGSTDSSALICDEYAKKDNRVIVYHQPNGGASSARNRGIDLAHGEWLIFVDVDDELTSDFFDSIAEILSVEDVDIVFFGNRVVFPSHLVEHFLERKIIDSADMSYIFTDCEIFTPWSKVFKRDILKNNRIYFDVELKNGEDTLFMFQYLEYVHKVATIDRILYIHYLTTGSLSTVRVSYDLNVRLLNQVTELVGRLEKRFRLTDSAKERLRETIAVCIGRFFKMNVLPGYYQKSAAILDQLDFDLYCHYLRPKSITGKLYAFLLKYRYYRLLDCLFKIRRLIVKK